MKSRRSFSLFAAVLLLLIGCLGGASAHAASPGWTAIAATNPTNLKTLTSETQQVLVSAEGGSFKLIVYRKALGLLRMTQGSTTATGAVAIYKLGGYGEFVPGQVFTAAPGTGFNIGLNEGTEITAINGDVLTLDQPATLSAPFPRGNQVTAAKQIATTDAIPVGADAEEVEDALNVALPAGDTVSVSGGTEGGHEGRYLITFGGNLAEQGIGPMEVCGKTDGSCGAGVGLTGNAVSTGVTIVQRGGRGLARLILYAENVGGAVSTSEPVTFTVTLPPGVGAARTPYDEGNGSGWNCPPVAYGATSFSCTTTETVPPGKPLRSLVAPIETAETTPGVKAIQMSVSGGGDPTPAVPGSECPGCELPLTISALPATPGLQSFIAAAYGEDGDVATQAGSHPPTGATAFFLNTVRNPATGRVTPATGEFKDIYADVPPGFLGNPIAVPQCPPSELGQCDRNTVVGHVEASLQGTASLNFGDSPVFNVEAPIGYPAAFYFQIGSEGQKVPLRASGSLRSDEDYGVTFGSKDTPQIATVMGGFVNFWGAPGDPSHDSQRCNFEGCGPYTGGPVTSLLTLPTNCAEEAEIPPSVRLRTNTWQAPFQFSIVNVPVLPATGCDKLHFESDFSFEPSDTKSDSPASFRSELTVPDKGLTGVTCEPEPGVHEPCLTTPEIKDAVVKLPEGVTLNPSGADGLQSCSFEQIGYKGNEFPMPNPIRFDKDPQTCPEASKIGTGELKTALLTDPLKGALYLADQGKGNPFGSLFAIYLVIEDPRHGIFIKLPGEVEPDKQTGQFQVTFRNLPQLPFTYLKLNLKGGNRSALASPTTCGHYATTAVSTPWSYPESGPPTESSNGFDINQGPNGQPCAPTKAARPFDVALKAGTEGTGAGKFSPLTFQVTRPDGSQELNTLEFTTAPGLSAKLKGVAQCTDAQIASASQKTGRQEQSTPSCPSASQIGKVVTAAGAGPTPFYTGGELYLAGPYKGAPLSVVAITPAVAGPFDLGNVVVRVAVFVNRTTGQVTAKSDPIPQILEGVPLRIKDVRVLVDRKDFTLNPTSCEAEAITAHATGNSGASKDLSARFQVQGCENLDFKPTLSAMVKGGTKRGDHPQFLANLTWPQGSYANTRDFQVTLPHSEFLDQAHIRTICTRVQALADACPEGSIYGFAEAETPILDGKLTGPVFLKSSDHKLPDLAIKLKGPDSMPIEVEFAGRIDSIHGQIRNTIEGLPDVPVSSFDLKMAGGKKGLLINSRNLCTTRKVHLDANGTAQNNDTVHLRPVLRNSCKGVRKAKRHHRRHHRRG